MEVNCSFNPNKNHYRKLIIGATLNDNLRNHANAPKILSTNHPHTKYQNCPRIQLKMLDPELKQYEQLLAKNDPEWFNLITPDSITCDCPKNPKFEQLFDKESTSDEAMCWTACKHTTLAAAKRQMKAAPTPTEEVAEDFFQHSKRIIDKEMGEQLKNFGYSVTDWYNHLTQKKQKALEHVLNYYKGDITKIPRKELSNIHKTHYTGILKEEVQGPDGKPRMVCSIPQKVKYIMGPVTWHLEEIAQDHLQGYCGGKNLDQMAAYINQHLSQGFTKIVEGDGSAFDNTQDVSLKEVDRYIYRLVADKIYHVPKKDFLEHSQAIYKTMDIEYIDKNTKKKKPLLRYTILGTVFSGDCDTTLMNTIRMALYNRYVNDKAGLVYGKDYVVFSKGDDFTLMYKPYVTNQFINDAYYHYFLDKNPDPSTPNASIYGLGQVLKFLEFGDASIIKFCSLNAWFTDPTEQLIYLTRDVHKFLTLGKYSKKAKTYTVLQKIAYLNDQAVSLILNYPNIQLFQHIAQHYMDLANRIMQDEGLTPQIIINYIRRQEQLQNRYKYKPTSDLFIQYFAELENLYIECVQHRRVQFKIQGEYWETMKYHETKHEETLPLEQAIYISKLIENEVSIEVIKSMYDVRLKKKF